MRRMVPLVCIVSFILSWALRNTPTANTFGTTFESTFLSGELECGKLPYVWHLAVIWNHGMPHYSDIVATLRRSSPSFHIHYQKVLSHQNISALVNVVYSEDISRVDARHIADKTRYLQSHVGNDLGIVVFFDTAPSLRKLHGEGNRSPRVNSRVLDIKRVIRKRYVPVHSHSSFFGMDGVYSHHHVIHITEGYASVNRILEHLGLPSMSSLSRTGDALKVPWFINLQQYSVETVRVASLHVRCASDAGSCRIGKLVPVSASPHYSFVSGDEKWYAPYYTAGLSEGRLNDDHSVEAFHHLMRKFDSLEYPKCVCDVDGIKRRSMIIVDKDLTILDGAHRAALLYAHNGTALVHVAQVGGKGEHAKTCTPGQAYIAEETITEPRVFSFASKSAITSNQTSGSGTQQDSPPISVSPSQVPMLVMYTTLRHAKVTKNALGLFLNSNPCLIHSVCLWTKAREAGEVFASFQNISISDSGNCSNVLTSSEADAEASQGVSTWRLLMLRAIRASVQSRPVLLMGSDMVVLSPILSYLIDFEPESDILILGSGLYASSELIFIRSTIKSREFVSRWLSSYENEMYAQVDDEMNPDIFLSRLLKFDLNGTTVSHLPADRFPSGKVYGQNRSLGIRSHELWGFHLGDIHGIENKISYLQSVGQWKPERMTRMDCQLNRG